MHRSLVLALSLAAGAASQPANARPGRMADDGPDHSRFWGEVMSPHREEVDALVDKASRAVKTADDALEAGATWAVDQRLRYFQDAYGLMRYARRLAPTRGDVLLLLARAADELGKTTQAKEALLACIDLGGADKAPAEALTRLGQIELRLGNRDAGIRWLRLAQGPLAPDTALALVYLANALSDRGDTAMAIDTLSDATPAQAPGFYPQELSLVWFTLAVLYDRDEQRSAAFDVIQRLQTALSTNFTNQIQSAIEGVRFVPAEDRYYYEALLDEVTGNYVEARAEWTLYAQTGATWRERALDHLHGIDQVLAAEPARTSRGTAPTLRIVPPRVMPMPPRSPVP